MRTVELFSRDFAAPEQVHATLAEALSFPEYYGANFAALSDCLGDITEPTRIELHLNGTSSPELAAWFEKLATVIARCALENEDLKLNLEDERR